MSALMTTISTKGQVILPKPVRDQLHWDAGTGLSVERIADGVLVRSLDVAFAPSNPEAVFGCLPHAGAAMSLDRMEAGIVAQARHRHARDRY